MRFAIDLVWLARDGGVLRLDGPVGAGRVRTCLRARGVVEVAAGSGPALAAALDARVPPGRRGPDGVPGPTGAGYSSSASSGRERVAR